MVSQQPFFQQPNNAPDSTVILQRHSYMFQLEGTLRNSDHAQSHYVFVTSYSSAQCIAYFCSLGCATSHAPYLKAWFPCLLYFFLPRPFCSFRSDRYNALLFCSSLCRPTVKLFKGEAYCDFFSCWHRISVGACHDFCLSLLTCLDMSCHVFA